MYQWAKAFGLPVTLSSAMAALQAVSRAAASAWLSRQVSISAAASAGPATARVTIDKRNPRIIRETLPGDGFLSRGIPIGSLLEGSPARSSDASLSGKALYFSAFCSRTRVSGPVTRPLTARILGHRATRGDLRTADPALDCPQPADPKTT